MVHMRRNKLLFINISISFIVLSMLSVILYYYYFHFHILFGARDLQFHLRRLMELKYAITHGKLLTSFSFNYFHGSAVMAMYPYISLFPFVFILLITHSLILSYYMFTIVVILVSLFTAFLASLKYSKSVEVSYLFSIVYSMSSSYVFEFFANGDLGVATSLAFLPMAVFGFLDILNGSKNYIKMAMGIVLTLFCQVPATIILIGTLIIWLIININYVNFHILMIIIKGFVLSILLTSIVWIPILYIILTNNIHTISHVSLSGTSIKFFIENISLTSIIALILTLIHLRKLNRYDKQMFIISIIIIFISSKFMPWHLITSIKPFDILNQFQFTFRFLIIPQILLCYLFSKVLIGIINKSHLHRILYLSVIIFVIMLQICSQCFLLYKKLNTPYMTFHSFHSFKLYDTKLQNEKSKPGFILTDNSVKYFIHGYCINNDYYPKASLNKRKYIFNNYSIYNNGHDFIQIKNLKYNKFYFYSNRNIHKLMLPFIKYNKEKLLLYRDHKALKNISSHGNILVLYDVPRGHHLFLIKSAPNIKIIILQMILVFIGLIWLIYACLSVF